MSKRLLLINIAGLGAGSVGPNTPHLDRLAGQGRGPIAVEPPLPALTSTSQATILTGTLPAQHGIVANGWYFRELAQVLNWQRSANLMAGERLWETADAGRESLRCVNLFWRYAAHASSSVNVVERPTYWADGRKSPDIYTEPGGVRDELVARLGPFPLFRFWGPAAGIESTRWIVDATMHYVRQTSFQLVMTYLPHLDYDHQRFGPDSPEGLQALRDMDAEAGRLIDAARNQQMHVAVVSDYAFEAVARPVYLNRVLREAGFVSVQHAENGELLEPGASQAFAVCDQQTAHVYVNDRGKDAVETVRQRLLEIDGVERVLDRQQMGEHGLDHPRSGELFAIAEPECWFAFPYWLDESQAPDFARCVAIHAKPGWDPSELFWRPGWGGKLHLAKRLLQKMLGLRASFDVISGDMSLVRGSHGRVPTNDQTRPSLITSWDVDLSRVRHLKDVKSLMVSFLRDS
jgi:predicted AlkP superfamily pyrophosphatase or phosphodiesterase